MNPKKTVYIEPALLGSDNDYIVIKLTNTVEWSIGQGLLKQEVQDMIDSGIQVHITRRS